MFEAINPKAILIALNYNCSSSIEFASKLEEKDLINKYNLQLQELKLQGNIPPAEVLNNLKGLFPCVYTVNDTKIEVIYTQNEFKLSITKLGMDKKEFDNFKNLSNDILDLKLSDINAIGINYSAEFDLGDARLDILNNKITGIPEFEQNLTFEFKLPIFYPERNLVASYRIKKIKGGDGTTDPHIYDINVNFHFDIKQLNTGEKAEKIKEILSYDLYDEFLNKSQEFLKLNNATCK